MLPAGPVRFGGRDLLFYGHIRKRGFPCGGTVCGGGEEESLLEIRQAGVFPEKRPCPPACHKGEREDEAVGRQVHASVNHIITTTI